MKFIFIICATFLSLFLCSDAMAEVKCVGMYERHSNDDPLYEEVELEVTYEQFGQRRVEGQIFDYYYSVFFDENFSTYRSGIYFGPGYTSGTISTGSFKEGEALKLAVVKQQEVFTILCN
ncbi:hypothetical protein A9Q84_18270 [Halobacteriovorax marinus]|uniref:Secreted protein n=1 Tax=Halobacteriovorax marinus TaxID=97084 RepID=A0A1Y5F326_9BACT|nr:hypothetical protein A9Q84_18270 [Halobacteriovorax marinus]